MMHRVFIPLLVVAALYVLPGSSSSRRDRDHAKCYEGEKMQRPDPTDIKKEDWEICCGEGFRFEPNPNNYVWPMETVEKMYFFISGISMLLLTAQKQFKIVEPQVCENTISASGFPISQLMTFDDVDPGKVLDKDGWMQTSGQQGPQLKNVFFVDLYPLKESQHTFCRAQGEDQFCYHLTNTKRENRIAIQFKAGQDIGVYAWSKIFTIIRSSPWAKENSITESTPLTLALYEHWHHALFEAKMLLYDKKSYGRIHPTEYFLNAARQILALNNFEKVSPGMVDNAIAWRLQKQFNHPSGKGKISELTQEIDKGGFVVGCQMGHLVKTMNHKKSDESPVALLFDIFANKGRGELDEANREVGPTTAVRKQIVRSLRRVFKKVVVVERMLQSMKRADFATADPLGLVYQDRATFTSWVEVSIGVSARRLVHAGGHFAEVLAEFRNGADVMDVYHPTFCSNSSADASEEDEGGGDIYIESESDDLVKILYDKDHAGLGKNKHVRHGIPNPNGGYLDEGGVNVPHNIPADIELPKPADSSSPSSSSSEMSDVPEDVKKPDRKEESGDTLVSLFFDHGNKKDKSSNSDSASETSSLGSTGLASIDETESKESCRYVLGIPIGCAATKKTSVAGGGKKPPPEVVPSEDGLLYNTDKKPSAAAEKSADAAIAAMSKPAPKVTIKTVGPPEIGGPGGLI